jgi:hypothetical protein
MKKGETMEKTGKNGIADLEQREGAETDKKKYDTPCLERLGRVSDLTRYDVSVWVP